MSENKMSDKVVKKFAKLSVEDRKAAISKLNELAYSNEPSDLKKEKKVKKERDPNAPKRAMNGYMHYANERRTKLKSEKPDLKPGELNAAMGAEWKAMSDDQKRPYSAKGAADQERYAAAKASYNH